MTWLLNSMVYVSQPFFLAMLAVSIFGPPLAFWLGRWSSTDRTGGVIQGRDGPLAGFSQRRPRQ